MPIPRPRKNEQQTKFIPRCMGNETMKKEYTKNVQRLAVCFSSWRKVHGGKPPTEEFIMSLKKQIEEVRSQLRKPAHVVAKAKALAEQLRIGNYRENLFHSGDVVFYEAFVSLRRELNQAVLARFGKNTYVSDFSNKEVIIGFERDTAEGPSYQTDKYVKIAYKVTKREVTFVGMPKDVEKVTSYESELTPCEFADAYFANKELTEKDE